MTIAFSCGCGATVKVPDSMAGKKGKCPSCGKALTAPANEKAAGDAKVPGSDKAPESEKRVADTFALASRDLTGSRDIALSDVDDDAPDQPAKPAAAAKKPAPPAPATARPKAAAMRFKCPHCSRTLTVPLSVAGQVGRCAGCGERFTAPVPEAVKQARARAAKQAASEPSLRDAFSVLKVRCSCGMTAAFPRARVAEGNARCPACDRSLSFDLTLAAGAGDDESAG